VDPLMALSNNSTGTSSSAAALASASQQPDSTSAASPEDTSSTAASPAGAPGGGGLFGFFAKVGSLFSSSKTQGVAARSAVHQAREGGFQMLIVVVEVLVRAWQITDLFVHQQGYDHS